MLPHTNERRYMCSELVSVLFEERSGKIRNFTANLEDIGRTGATLLCERRVTAGTPISFCAKGRDLYGVVAASTRDPLLGWLVEIKFDPFSRWHPRLFVPQHFLALSASGRDEPIEDVTLARPVR